MARVKSADHHIYLNAEARSDIAWWITFVEPWNRVSLMLPREVANLRHMVV